MPTQGRDKLQSRAKNEALWRTEALKAPHARPSPRTSRKRNQNAIKKSQSASRSILPYIQLSCAALIYTLISRPTSIPFSSPLLFLSSTLLSLSLKPCVQNSRRRVSRLKQPLSRTFKPQLKPCVDATAETLRKVRAGAK